MWNEKRAPRFVRAHASGSLALALVLHVGCDGGARRNAPPPQAAGPPGYYGAPPAAPYPAYGVPSQPGYAPSPPYGPTQYGQPGYSGAPAPQTPTPSPTPGMAPVPIPGAGAPDPITLGDVPWLRARAASLMQELIAVLPEPAHGRVAAIPLAVDDTPGEVNAFAACIRGGAVMVVTDALLDIAGHLAEARANDEGFGTRKVDEYIALIAHGTEPGRPVPRPRPGFFEPAQQGDPRRVARQHELFDELVGFVLGHELAHHHLGHLPCTGAPGPFGMGELARGLSGAVPLFNQPNEIAADVAGTNDLLAAGARRTGYRLGEGGALVLMQFFSAVDQLSPADVVFAFDRTHPPPALRGPVIQQAASFWRARGGVPFPVFGF